jgi:hypothetical protein
MNPEYYSLYGSTASPVYSAWTATAAWQPTTGNVGIGTLNPNQINAYQQYTIRIDEAAPIENTPWVTINVPDFLRADSHVTIDQDGRVVVNQQEVSEWDE